MLESSKIRGGALMLYFDYNTPHEGVKDLHLSIQTAFGSRQQLHCYSHVPKFPKAFNVPRALSKVGKSCHLDHI